MTGYDKAATQLVAVLDGMGLRSRDGDVFDLTGPVDGPARHLSSPTIALDPKTPAAEGFRAVLALTPPFLLTARPCIHPTTSAATPPARGSPWTRRSPT